MQDIGELLVRSTKKRFPEGEAPDGSKWLPKSATTLAAYQARGDRMDFRPLFGPLGACRRRFPTSRPRRLFGRGRVEPDLRRRHAVRRGTGGPLALRRAAARSPGARYPRDRFLGISEEDRTNILATITEWLEEAIAEAIDGSRAARQPAQTG